MHTKPELRAAKIHLIRAQSSETRYRIRSYQCPGQIASTTSCSFQTVFSNPFQTALLRKKPFWSENFFKISLAILF